MSKKTSTVPDYRRVVAWSGRRHDEAAEQILERYKFKTGKDLSDSDERASYVRTYGDPPDEPRDYTFRNMLAGGVVGFLAWMSIFGMYTVGKWIVALVRG